VELALAASPILVACTLLLVLRQSALRAGFVGLVIAVIAALFVQAGSLATIGSGLRDGCCMR
jgi:L-lactate permease